MTPVLKPIILDTNLLLLLVVGAFDKDYVGGYKRTAKYTEEDYDIVYKEASRAPQIVVTPHILAEVTNYTTDIPGQYNLGVNQKVVEVLGNTKYREAYTEMAVFLSNDLLLKLGFTDLSIIEAAKAHAALIISGDHRLCGNARKLGIATINYTHLQGQRWFQDYESGPKK